MKFETKIVGDVKKNLRTFIQDRIEDYFIQLELARHIGLSRTRCNEYFKQMKEMGMVEPVLIGREKFYRLS